MAGLISTIEDPPLGRSRWVRIEGFVSPIGSISMLVPRCWNVATIRSPEKRDIGTALKGTDIDDGFGGEGVWPLFGRAD